MSVQINQTRLMDEQSPNTGAELHKCARVRDWQPHPEDKTSSHSLAKAGLSPSHGAGEAELDLWSPWWGRQHRAPFLLPCGGHSSENEAAPC